MREHLLARVAAAPSASGGGAGSPGADAEQRQLQALLAQTEVSEAQLQELLGGGELPESERRALAVALEREGEACFVLPPAAAAELSPLPREALAACATDSQAFQEQLSRLVWGSPAFSAPQVGGLSTVGLHAHGACRRGLPAHATARACFPSHSAGGDRARQCARPCRRGPSTAAARARGKRLQLQLCLASEAD